MMWSAGGSCSSASFGRTIRVTLEPCKEYSCTLSTIKENCSSFDSSAHDRYGKRRLGALLCCPHPCPSFPGPCAPAWAPGGTQHVHASRIGHNHQHSSSTSASSMHIVINTPSPTTCTCSCRSIDPCVGRYHCKRRS